MYLKNVYLNTVVIPNDQFDILENNRLIFVSSPLGEELVPVGSGSGPLSVGHHIEYFVQSCWGTKSFYQHTRHILPRYATILLPCQQLKNKKQN
jgi:hypothetical protein